MKYCIVGNWGNFRVWVGSEYFAEKTLQNAKPDRMMSSAHP